jgi:hypothetical protein
MHQRSARPLSREDYFVRRRPVDLHGRLGYAGLRPKLVGCEVLELSDTGAYVETYALIDDVPQLFTLEINGEYHRARLIWSEGRNIMLAFFREELHYLEAD